jgi:hypothetical protein
MKPVRLLNVILVVAFALCAVAWFVGFFRQHADMKIDWPIAAAMLCWGVVATTMSAKAMMRGKFPTRSGGFISRERDPAEFWTGVGIFSVVGMFMAIIGACKLISLL